MPLCKLICSQLKSSFHLKPFAPCSASFCWWVNSHGGFGCYIKCLLVLHWHHKNSLRCFFVHLSCCISNSNGLSGTAISFSESLSQAGIGDDTSSSLKVCFLVITLYVGVRQSSSLHWKRWLFCYRNPFSICFSSPLLPSLCCPCGLSFVWGRLKGREAEFLFLVFLLKIQ